MRLLILGGGGREHALYKKILSDDADIFVRVLPGNGGIPSKHRINVSATDFAGIASVIDRWDIDTVVVGPEQPLVDGIVDYLSDRPDLFIFGPSRAGAMLEGSKAEAKAFMERNGIPTAGYRVFTNEDKARSYISALAVPFVIKASGLAAGKGVSIHYDRAEGMRQAEMLLSGRRFGEAGREIVIERYISGREASVFLVLDNASYAVFGTAQDYKRLRDGDIGPNTGGMGAFSPAKVITEDVWSRIERRIVEPTVRGLRREGRNYRGILYLGLMIDDTGEPYVIEYNCRLGDPEAQVILPRLKSKLVDIISAVRDHRLDKFRLEFHAYAAVTVVLAAEGYPGQYRKGVELPALPEDTMDAMVFHAGTDRVDGRLISSGGRVLNFTGIGPDLCAAHNAAYDFLQKVRPSNQFFYRREIALDYI